MHTPRYDETKATKALKVTCNSTFRRQSKQEKEPDSLLTTLFARNPLLTAREAWEDEKTLWQMFWLLLFSSPIIQGLGSDGAQSSAEIVTTTNKSLKIIHIRVKVQYYHVTACLFSLHFFYKCLNLYEMLQVANWITCRLWCAASRRSQQEVNIQMSCSGVI